MKEIQTAHSPFAKATKWSSLLSRWLHHRFFTALSLTVVLPFDLLDCTGPSMTSTSSSPAFATAFRFAEVLWVVVKGTSKLSTSIGSPAVEPENLFKKGLCLKEEPPAIDVWGMPAAEPRDRTEDVGEGLREEDLLSDVRVWECAGKDGSGPTSSSCSAFEESGDSNRTLDSLQSLSKILSPDKPSCNIRRFPSILGSAPD